MYEMRGRSGLTKEITMNIYYGYLAGLLAMSTLAPKAHGQRVLNLRCYRKGSPTKGLSELRPFCAKCQIELKPIY